MPKNGGDYFVILGQKLKPATVLYPSAEHAAAPVIQPRFAGLHEDPARLVVLRGAVSMHSMSSPDSALRALPNTLEDALQKTRAHLVILDPREGFQGSIEIAAEAKFDIGVRSSKTENQVPGGGLCRIRRMSTLRSTRQDAQINYLSILSIFVKQTTYLATLPNKVRKLGKSHRVVAMATYGAARLGAMWGRDTYSLLLQNLSSRLRSPRRSARNSGISSMRYFVPLRAIGEPCQFMSRCLS